VATWWPELTLRPAEDPELPARTSRICRMSDWLASWLSGCLAIWTNLAVLHNFTSAWLLHTFGQVFRLWPVCLSDFDAVENGLGPGLKPPRPPLCNLCPCFSSGCRRLTTTTSGQQLQFSFSNLNKLSTNAQLWVAQSFGHRISAFWMCHLNVMRMSCAEKYAHTPAIRLYNYGILQFPHIQFAAAWLRAPK